MSRSGIDGVLVGPVSIDRYVATGETMPGGGALNMAWHWARAGVDFRLVSRVSRDDHPVVAPFLDRHGISATSALWQPGPSCSIEVVIGDDLQPVMNHFVEGIWSHFTFSAEELDLVRSGVPTHLVLVDAVDRELLRRRAELAGSRLSGDFLGFGHFDRGRFDSTFPMLEVGFIGWPGPIDDPIIDDFGRRCGIHGNVLVVTFGSRGVLVFDGRTGSTERFWFDVEAVPVRGTTIGCGDSFIAAFLSAWHRDGCLPEAVARGKSAGAAATAWIRPLPDIAYGSAAP